MSVSLDAVRQVLLVYLSVCLPACLSVRESLNCLSVCRSVGLSVHLSVSSANLYYTSVDMSVRVHARQGPGVTLGPGEE